MPDPHGLTRLGGIPVFRDERIPVGKIMGSEAGLHVHPLDEIAIRHHDDLGARSTAALAWIIALIERRAAEAEARIDAMFRSPAGL